VRVRRKHTVHVLGGDFSAGILSKEVVSRGEAANDDDFAL
jgi:hypothetical protein